MEIKTAFWGVMVFYSILIAMSVLFWFVRVNYKWLNKLFDKLFRFNDDYTN